MAEELKATSPSDYELLMEVVAEYEAKAGGSEKNTEIDTGRQEEPKEEEEDEEERRRKEHFRMIMMKVDEFVYKDADEEVLERKRIVQEMKNRWDLNDFHDKCKLRSLYTLRYNPADYARIPLDHFYDFKPPVRPGQRPVLQRGPKRLKKLKLDLKGMRKIRTEAEAAYKKIEAEAAYKKASAEVALSPNMRASFSSPKRTKIADTVSLAGTKAPR